VIGAILWAQWKSIRFTRFGSGKSAALFSALTGLLWYGFWGVMAVGVAAFTGDVASRRDIGALFPAMLIFVILILSGFFYIYKKGALDWSGADISNKKQ